MSQRLSLSLGLRWEVNPAARCYKGLKPYTFQGSGPDTWSLAPQGTPLWQTTWYNFAPRLGVAYMLRNTPGWETVVRSGGGVFFDTGQQLGSVASMGQGLHCPQHGFTGGPHRFQGLSAMVPAHCATTCSAVLRTVYALCPASAITLYTAVERQHRAGAWQVAGSNRLLCWLACVEVVTTKLDFPRPTTRTQVSFDYIDNGLTSDYDSLQIQFRRRLSRGLTALASYSWSHCLDYGSENYNLAYQRGNCDFDVRHNLSAAFSYDLPNVGHNGFVNAVLHHWGLDDRLTARTAFPVTLYGNATPATEWADCMMRD